MRGNNCNCHAATDARPPNRICPPGSRRHVLPNGSQVCIPIEEYLGGPAIGGPTLSSTPPAYVGKPWSPIPDPSPYIGPPIEPDPRSEVPPHYIGPPVPAPSSSRASDYFKW